jgi:hypothetical protein
MAEYCEITTGKVEIESATFFKALLKYFPDATTFVTMGLQSISHYHLPLYSLHSED